MRTTPNRTRTQQRAALLGSRWMQTVSCYRVTTAYLLVAAVTIALLLML